jgi:hypothetical protein
VASVAGVSAEQLVINITAPPTPARRAPLLAAREGGDEDTYGTYEDTYGTYEDTYGTYEDTYGTYKGHRAAREGGGLKEREKDGRRRRRGREVGEGEGGRWEKERERGGRRDAVPLSMVETSIYGGNSAAITQSMGSGAALLSKLNAGNA